MFNINNIFYNVVYTSLLASFVIIVITLIKKIFNSRFSANFHYYIWFIAILRLLLPILPESNLSIFNIFARSSTKYSLANNYTDLIKTNTINQISGTTSSNTAALGLSSATSSSLITPLNILIVIWLIGLLISLMIPVISYIRFLNKNNHCQKIISNRLNDSLAKCLKIMNTNRKARIYYSDSITTPLVYGFFRKTILIPMQLKDKLTDVELSYIICHELGHIKRLDPEFNFLFVLIQSLHWFNPFVWYGLNKARSDCENACDALVLKKLSGKEILDYGKTIIKLASLSTFSRLSSLNLCLINKKTNIKRRIIMIKKFNKKSVLVTLLSIFLVGAIAILCLTNTKKTANTAANSNKKDVASTETVKLNDTSKTPASSVNNTKTPAQTSKESSTTSNDNKQTAAPAVAETPAETPVEPAQEPVVEPSPEPAAEQPAEEPAETPAEPAKADVPLSTQTITSDSIVYTNNQLGIQFTMPLSWQGKYTIEENPSYIAVSYVYKNTYDNELTGTTRLLFAVTPDDCSSPYSDFIPGSRQMDLGGRSVVVTTPTDTLDPSMADYNDWQVLENSKRDVINTLTTVDVTYQ